VKKGGPFLYQPIEFKATALAMKYSTSRSSLRPAFVLISLVLVCFALSPAANAQAPNIFTADNPSGSVNSGGANLAYLQNTTGGDVTLTLDGNTITTKANRLNIFDKSSGAWIPKVILNPQSQPISTSQPTPTPSPTPTGNGLLTGLYAYYKLDEASGAGALDAGSGGRNLIQSNGGGIIGSVPGIVNTARSFPGTAMFIRNVSTTDFSPRSNHFFVTFWAKAGSLGQREMEMVSKFTSETGNKEWIVFLDLSSRKPIFFASSDGNTVTSVTGSLPFANTSTWYFIAAGWDGNNIKISVNGGPYVTASFVGPIFAGAAVFTIGSENGTLPWIGQIDEMAIWIGRNDLTISDVQQIYNNGAGLPFSSFH
jgi:Concanavalin A-like lectin/glucanases superfamily